MDGQGTTWRRNIAENFNRLSRVHQRYRQTTDRQTDRRWQITNMNLSSRSLKTQQCCINHSSIIVQQTLYTVTVTCGCADTASAWVKCGLYPHLHPHFTTLNVRRSAHPHFTRGRYSCPKQWHTTNWTLKKLSSLCHLSEDNSSLAFYQYFNVW